MSAASARQRKAHTAWCHSLLSSAFAHPEESVKISGACLRSKAGLGHWSKSCLPLSRASSNMFLVCVRNGGSQDLCFAFLPPLAVSEYPQTAPSGSNSKSPLEQRHVLLTAVKGGFNGKRAKLPEVPFLVKHSSGISIGDTHACVFLPFQTRKPQG